MIVAGPHTTVGLEAVLALELAQRGLGLGAEDPVLATGIETERVEPTLKVDHVVAAQHRRTRVEEAIAEAVAALDQRAPGLGAADPVEAQAALGLELAYGRERLRAEDAIERDGITTAREALLEITNGGPGVTGA